MAEEKQITFEESLAELETIVRGLEAGELPLEDALGAFERGVGLVRRLHALLDDAEQRVEVLGRDGEGRLRLTALTAKDTP